ncbi:MAG TPA: HD domain-containing phosphohydrolase [Acidobacteriaceae bacterium]|nr:HD domain-containing phosphohydrolase [Acidobacteriaceae bacterium]
MTSRAKALVCVVVAGALVSLWSVHAQPGRRWLELVVYLVAILISSNMKVPMPKSNGTMSVNFPFILLGIVQLAPGQAVLLAVASVIAQCRVKVVKAFTLVQILFNIANVTTATALACHTYAASLGMLHGQVAPALTIAVTVYFLANTVPLALVLGWESGTSPLRQWRDEFPWYFPFYLVGAMLAALANFIGDHYGWLTSMLLLPMAYTIYRAYRAQIGILRDRERHIRETEALHLRTIEGLAMAIEAKDKNTHRHLMRVRVYVSELGRLMGLDDSTMKALVTASYLHDIGKLAVPEYIINKPGKLTREEFEKMKIHPVVGADILERVRFPYPVVPIVRGHHESWDGSGYPDGLRAAEIPIGARILTAVDCLDALASERPYRRAMPLDEAMAFVKKKAGVQFDPDVVGLLSEHYPRLEQMAREATTEDIHPLNTDMFISRGEAPGNGYEPEKSPQGGGENGFAAPAGVAAALRKLRLGLKHARDVRETGAVLAHALQNRIPFDCIAVYTRTDTAIRVRYMNGPCECAFSSQPISLGEGLSGWVAENARCIMNGNPTVEPNFVADAGLFTPESSGLAVPLFSSSGVVFGVVVLYSREQAAFSKDHRLTLEDLMPEFASALERALRADEASARQRACLETEVSPVLESARAS